MASVWVDDKNEVPLSGNILAGKELVPEFMPYFSSIEPIAERIERLLEDRDKLTQISGWAD